MMVDMDGNLIDNHIRDLQIYQLIECHYQISNLTNNINKKQFNGYWLEILRDGKEELVKLQILAIAIGILLL